MSPPMRPLHLPHFDPKVEAKARAIYLERNGAHGGVWEANETPEIWWAMAEQRLAEERIGATHIDVLAGALQVILEDRLLLTAAGNRKDWFRVVATKLIQRFPVLDPRKPTPAPSMPNMDLWKLAKRHAGDAMAEIAERQMKTWQQPPPQSGPTELIQRAIIAAITEALKTIKETGHDEN